MSTTSIEWTDYTVNPGIYGCEEVSPACAHCYAAKMAHRQVEMGNYPAGITTKRASGVHWSGVVRVDYGRIGPAFESLPKRKPARVFVTSMADLFHADVPDAFIERVFSQMAGRPHLTFQVLTKRPERIASWWAGTTSALDDMPWPSNVWIGTTVEDQRRADERIPHLLRVPAPVRFLSMEPLLGPVDLSQIRDEGCGTAGCDYSHTDALDGFNICDHGYGSRPARVSWVIAGGESGHHARPSHPDWFRSLRDQCEAAGVPFFMKQMGSLWARENRASDGHGGDWREWADEFRVREVPHAQR